jgi:hypothetical protein
MFAIRFLSSYTAPILLLAGCGGGTEEPAAVDRAALSTTFQQLPLPVAGKGETPAAVAASSPSDGWVVGTFTTNPGTTFFTLTEHWNGSSWTVVPSPNLSASGVNQLLAVADISPTDAWAVGQMVDTATHPLVIHWNGRAWTVFPTAPDPGGSAQYFTAVRGLAANDVWMTGQHFVAGVGEVSFIEHFDGSAWHIVPTPSVFSPLNALAPVSAKDVWAAGGASLLHWDGSSWVLVSGAPTPAGATTITSLAAVSSNDVWAVGVTRQFGRHGKSFQLIEHWNGTSWSLVASPPAAQGSELTSVAAVSTRDVWAAGFLTLPDGSTAIQHWDGTSWSLLAVPAPQPPTITQIMHLDALKGGTVFGLGSNANGPDVIFSNDG